MATINMIKCRMCGQQWADEFIEYCPACKEEKEFGESIHGLITYHQYVMKLNPNKIKENVKVMGTLERVHYELGELLKSLR